MIDWLPGWIRVDLGPDGGPYDESAHPKACVHTTEGGSLGGAESAYAAYPPHLGYDPRYRTKHQYVRLDRHSYAFRGAESDDECIIQVEIVGRAAETHTWPDEWYRNIGEDVIAPLRQHMGIPDQHLRFYRADEGIVLARATSPIRLSDTQFRAFSGWLGHQHIPAPDEHWDPGGFLMDKALAYSRPAPKTPIPVPVPVEEDEMAKTFYAKGDTAPDIWCFTFDGEAATGRHVQPAEWAIVRAGKVEAVVVKQAEFDAMRAAVTT